MPLTDTRGEAELLRLAVAGDEDAFRVLYERLKANVYRFALHMSGSVTLAEDITHDSFITLVEQAERFDESRGEVLPFLLGIARNLVRRAHRSQLRSAPMTAENEKGEEVELALEASHDTVAEVLRGETVDLVREAIQSLPQHYREVVVLCDLCEVSYADASAQLNCNIGTIRSRLNRAHALLAKKLSPRIQPADKKAGGIIQGCLP